MFLVQDTDDVVENVDDFNQWVWKRRKRKTRFISRLGSGHRRYCWKSWISNNEHNYQENERLNSNVDLDQDKDDIVSDAEDREVEKSLRKD